MIFLIFIKETIGESVNILHKMRDYDLKHLDEGIKRKFYYFKFMVQGFY